MPVAGPLREYVAIQTNSPTRDAFGDEADVWATAETVNASVKPVRGGESWAAAAVQAGVDYVFRVRYTANATPKARLSWDSRTFEIVFVKNSDPVYLGAERDTFLDVMAKEIVTT